MVRVSFFCLFVWSILPLSKMLISYRNSPLLMNDCKVNLYFAHCHRADEDWPHKCWTLAGRCVIRAHDKSCNSLLYRLFVCLFFGKGGVVPLENFSLIWRRHHYWCRAAIFLLMLGTHGHIELWGFFSVPRDIPIWPLFTLSHGGSDNSLLQIVFK